MPETWEQLDMVVFRRKGRGITAIVSTTEATAIGELKRFSDSCRLERVTITIEDAAKELIVHCASSDSVNHPKHYGGDTIYETIKVIEAWGLGFNLGNSVKYISRADNKGAPIEDLQKARWYLDREIARRESGT